MEPLVARKTWRTLEPLHGLVYFALEAAERFGALGLEGRSGYFASRSAPMGAVPAAVVEATFFNFHPALVAAAMDGVWDLVTPDDVLAARSEAAVAALRRGLGPLADDPAVREAADLARPAAEAAAEHPAGRPLFAGHVDLPWPDDDPIGVLWHAQTLLREFRGDGHIAALVAEGFDALDALVTHGASGEVPSAVLQQTRAWPDDEWAAGADRLVERGWLGADGALTEAGAAARQRVEDATDRLALVAYEPLGEQRCERLRQVARPLSRAVVDSGLLRP